MGFNPTLKPREGVPLELNFSEDRAEGGKKVGFNTVTLTKIFESCILQVAHKFLAGAFPAAEYKRGFATALEGCLRACLIAYFFSYCPGWEPDSTQTWSDTGADERQICACNIRSGSVRHYQVCSPDGAASTG